MPAMRLPNGYGSVYKLSGRRRNPWAARKTIGWNEKGQPIYRFIGYYHTRAEAQTALGEFNAHPEAISHITLEALYERWLKSDPTDIKQGTLTTYKATWRLAATIKHMEVNDIRLDHYEEAAELTGSPRSVVSSYKSMLSNVMKYGIKYELINPTRLEVVRYINLKKFPAGKTNKRHPFSIEAIEKLWQHTDNWDVRFVLVMIHTGLRIGEITNLLKTDVDLDNRCLKVVDAKTEAGIRTVPIIDRILPFFVSDSSAYAFEKTFGRPISLGSRTSIFGTVEELTGEHHTPHDTRHTFISMMIDTDTPLRTIQKIVGHKSGNVTEDVYMHLSMDNLRESMERTADLLLTCY